MARRSLSFFFALIAAMLAFAAVASACAGPHHDHAVAHTVERRQDATADIAAMRCPVCGMEVDGTTFVDINNGQKVYTCSEQHAVDVYNDPLKYARAGVTLAATMDMTPVPGVKCPFCKMDGVMGHALPLEGNQTVYACMMAPHFQQLTDNASLKTAFKGTTIGTDAMAGSSSSSAAPSTTTPEPSSSMAPSPSAAADTTTMTTPNMASAASVSMATLCLSAAAAVILA